MIKKGKKSKKKKSITKALVFFFFVFFFCFFLRGGEGGWGGLWKNFLGTQKRAQVSHGKVIEVLMHIGKSYSMIYKPIAKPETGCSLQ